MSRSLPLAAPLLGVAGLIPFIGCGIAAVAVGDADQARRGVQALIAYGAVILAFLGGVHWGFALDSATATPPIVLRLGLGVVPSLVGWLAIMVPIVLPLETGLALLIVGFIGVVVLEAGARRRGVMPDGYMVLRWSLTVVVVLILATVLTLRLVGAQIVF